MITPSLPSPSTEVMMIKMPLLLLQLLLTIMTVMRAMMMVITLEGVTLAITIVFGCELRPNFITTQERKHTKKYDAAQKMQYDKVYKMLGNSPTVTYAELKYLLLIFS